MEGENSPTRAPVHSVLPVSLFWAFIHGGPGHKPQFPGPSSFLLMCLLGN